LLLATYLDEEDAADLLAELHLGIGVVLEAHEDLNE
jgi:hypothetical protein